MHIEIYHQICLWLDELLKENDEIIVGSLSEDDLYLKFEKLQKLAILIGTQLEAFEKLYKKEIQSLEQFCEFVYEASSAVEKNTDFKDISLNMKELFVHQIMPVKDNIVPTGKIYSIDILGSCVSRVVMLDGRITEHGVADPYIKLNHFFDKNNIVFCMMPPPFSKEEVETVEASQLWDSSRINAVKQCLDKSTIPLLLSDNSDYLILDFYDFQVTHAFSGDTGFSTCANEFFNTELYQEHKSDIYTFHWKDVPTFLYYPYIDLFFEKISAKYDSDHIILNRFKAVSHYIDKQNTIQPLSDEFMQSYHANYHYNELVRRLEDYVIEKYHPYVIDLSKYFMGDENLWENLNGAHYQKIFYEESFQIIRNIILGHPSQKIYDKLSPDAVVRILELQLDTKEFIAYLNQVSFPFNTGYSLDELISQLTITDIAENRELIANRYRKLGMVKSQ